MAVRIRVVGGRALVRMAVSDALGVHTAGRFDWQISPGGEVAEQDDDVVIVIASGDEMVSQLQAIEGVAPSAIVVWVAESINDRNVFEAAALGCNGIVSLDNDVSELVHAVAQTVGGTQWVSPDLIPMVLQALKPVPSDDTLTAREVEVLGLLRAGRSTVQIGAELYISAHTVKNHIRRILLKLQAHSRLEAVSIAIDRQLI